ncbi:MAG: hypothetical protein ABJ239_02730 [Erythrobacter sp.]
MTESVKTPWHLWVVGILTLLWNSVGGMSYTFTRLGMLESLGMTPDQIAYFDTYPIWANTAWALGVWGAIAASLLLLARSRHAVTAIIIATIGLIGTSIYQHVLTQTPESLQSPGLAISIWLTTLFMLWYSIRMKSAGVLR